MRTAVPVAAILLVAALAALIVVTRGEDDAYRVRAIFDNAGFIIPGEDVKIAGVKVGKVTSLEADFSTRRATTADWMRALRLHQWAKNGLLFLPLLLAGAEIGLLGVPQRLPVHHVVAMAAPGGEHHCIVAGLPNVRSSPATLAPLG